MYILLIAHIAHNNVVLMKEQESLKGIVGWSVLLHKFVNGMEWGRLLIGAIIQVRGKRKAALIGGFLFSH